MTPVEGADKPPRKLRGRHPEKRLNNIAARAAGPGRHADGNGLYLHVDPSGARRRVRRIAIRRKRREPGLGSCVPVTLAKARETARRNRKAARADLGKRRIPHLRRPRRRSRRRRPAEERQAERAPARHAVARGSGLRRGRARREDLPGRSPDHRIRHPDRRAVGRSARRSETDEATAAWTIPLGE